MLHGKAVLSFDGQLLESFTQEAHSQSAGINSESRFPEGRFDRSLPEACHAEAERILPIFKVPGQGWWQVFGCCG
jgi:hypothetical protein